MLNDECRVRVSGCSSPALNGSKKKKKALSDRCFDLDFTIFFFCAHVPVISWEVATIQTMELPTIRAVIFYFTHRGEFSRYSLSDSDHSASVVGAGNLIPGKW